MIIGYKVQASIFNKVIKTEYFLSSRECLISKIWRLRRLPFVNVCFCVVQDSDYSRYTSDVYNIRKLKR